VNTESISDEVLSDLADRIGRFATDHMQGAAVICAPTPSNVQLVQRAERRNFAIAGGNAAFFVLDAVRERSDWDDFISFIDGLRDVMAHYEEHAA